jgi:hypothetical protein
MKKLCFGFLGLVLVGQVFAADVKLTEEYTWLDGGSVKKVWFDSTQVAEVVNPSTAVSARSSKQVQMQSLGFSQAQQKRNLVFWRRSDGAAQTRAKVAALKDTAGVLPVYRQGPSTGSSFLVPAAGVLVQIADKSVLEAWTKQKGKSLTPVAGGVAWLVETAPGEESLSVATELRKLSGVKTSMPNWMQDFQLK